MVNTTFRVAAATLTLLVPLAAQAQRGGGPRMNRMGAGNPVAPLIDMRRELNLTGRQLVQLDSIERGLLERNQVVRQQLRSRLDSLRPRNRASSEEEIAAYRAEGDSMRALRRVIVRNDSTARAAAMSVLTDSQRGRVRERTAERRGFEAGRRSGVRGERGFRGDRMRPRMRGQDGRIRPDGRGMRAPGTRPPINRGGRPLN